MESKGTPLDLLPFEGAVWIIDNGENIVNQKHLLLDSQKTIKDIFLFQARRYGKLLISRLLTQSIRDEFGIYDIPSP